MKEFEKQIAFIPATCASCAINVRTPHHFLVDIVQLAAIVKPLNVLLSNR